METGERRDGLQLDYAPASSVRRIRRRRILLFIVLMILTAGIWKWGAPVRRQAAMLYWQRQCLTYSAPPDMVVYEEDPAAAAALLAKSWGYSKYPLKRGEPDTTPPTVIAAALKPGCFKAFTDQNKNSLAVAFERRWLSGAVVFMHERTSPSGHRRLVIVHYFPPAESFATYFMSGFNYSAVAITPGTTTTFPIIPVQYYAFSASTSWSNTPPLVRMFAGQIDPADPSHFTIAYDMWGKTDTLVGRLDDADKVTLKPRHLQEWPKGQ